jgi:hypothetical protein
VTTLIALLLAAPALAQEAPEEVRFTAFFQHDRAGAVVGMDLCRNDRCVEIDLTGFVVRPIRGGFAILDEDDATASFESWDNCHYDYVDQVSECDEFVLPEPCNCSEPNTWPEGGQA